MPAAVPRAPLTKPLLARFILEGGAAAVCLILLVWLLLWFWWQTPNEQRVIALRVAPDWVRDEVPYQQSDVHGLRAADDGATVEERELPSMVEAATKRNGASVVYISWPSRHTELSGDDPNTLAKRLKEIIQKTHGNLFLALDLSQIDSDRALGVYGNAPAWTLPEQLKDVLKDRHNVFVLCSSQPGQKSWMIDGLGRSAFAYFLELGLKRPENKRGQMKAAELADYVTWNVSRWVNSYRKAEQTPWRLPHSASFRLPALTFAVPKAAEPPPEPEPEPKPTPKIAATAKGEAVAEAPPAPAPKPKDPKIALLDDLMEEWKSYLKRKKDPKKPPYHFAPVAWRRYEFELLRAERLVRRAQNDQYEQNAAGQLATAKKAGNDVDEAIKAEVAKENQAYFRPIKLEPGDPGVKALNSAFKYLTNYDELTLSQWIVNDPKPAAEAAKKGAMEEKEPSVAPDELLAARTESWTKPYLELQLAAWADKFQNSLKVPKFFRSGPRGGRLRDAIMARLPAEQALALDRRGLDWIRRSIVDGDKARREVQDALFDPNDVVLNDLPAQITRYKQIYVNALNKAGDYRAARDLFEQMADELPFYAEWKILDAAVEPKNDEGAEDGLPDVVENAFKAAETLALTLEKGHDKRADSAPFGALKEAVEQSQSMLQGLRMTFDETCRLLLTSSDWPQRDAVLRTPLIEDLDLRRRLVERSVRTEEPSATDPTAVASNPETATKWNVDPGFARRAEGLARVEAFTIRMASPPTNKGFSNDSELSSTLDEHPAGGDRQLERLARLSDLLSRGSALWNTLGRSSQPGGPPRSGPASDANLATRLRDNDRATRFHSSGDLQPSEDDAASNLFKFARRETLSFHAERLIEDFVRDVSPIAQLADAEFPVTPSNFRLPKPAFLTLEVIDPKSHIVDIDPMQRTGRFTATLLAKTEAARPGEEPQIPRGKALVVALPRETDPPPADDAPTPPGTKKEAARLQLSLLENNQPRTEVGRLAGKLGQVGLTEDETPAQLAFQVRQLTSEPRGKTGQRIIDVQYFYRGRVGDRDGELIDAKVAVNVITKDFGEDVTLEIRQDPDELKKNFKEYVTIKDDKYVLDQFERNQYKSAYLHEKTPLPYWLLVQNNHPTETKQLVVKRTISGGNIAPKESDEPVTITLRPGQKEVVRGKLRPGDFPILGESRTFEVKIFEGEKDVVQALKIQVTQMKLESYIKFKMSQGRDRLHPGDRIAEVLIFRVTRDADDPNTDPILYRDIKLEQNGDRGLDKFDPGEGRLAPEGSSFSWSTYIVPGETKITTTITIEGTTKAEPADVVYRP